jgi:hypothetical protein
MHSRMQRNALLNCAPHASDVHLKVDGHILAYTTLSMARRMQAMWIIGPTAMLITSVVTTSAIAYLDRMVVYDASYTKLLVKRDNRAGKRPL